MNELLDSHENKAFARDPGGDKARDGAKREKTIGRKESEGKPPTDNPHHPSGHAHRRDLEEAKARQEDGEAVEAGDAGEDIDAK